MCLFEKMAKRLRIKFLASNPTTKSIHSSVTFKSAALTYIFAKKLPKLVSQKKKWEPNIRVGFCRWDVERALRFEWSVDKKIYTSVRYCQSHFIKEYLLYEGVRKIRPGYRVNDRHAGEGAPQYKGRYLAWKKPRKLSASIFYRNGGGWPNGLSKTLFISIWVDHSPGKTRNRNNVY